MKNKKAQLEMMQTAFVLLILFVLFTIALIFFIGYQKTGIRKKQREVEGLELIKKSQVLNFLPELQCSFDGIVYHDCYDLRKIETFQSKIIDDTSPSYSKEVEYFYKQLLGDVRIIISKYKTKREGGRGWEENWLPPPEESDTNLIVNFKNEEKKSIRQLQFPVSIYDPNQNIYSFGIIYLEISQ